VAPAITPPATARKSSSRTPVLIFAGVAVLALCLCAVAIVALVMIGGESLATATPTPVPFIPPASPTPVPFIPTATPVSGMSEPQLSSLLFEDDFGDPDSGWDVFDDSDTAADYDDGAYRLAVYKAEYMTWGNPDPVQDLADFAVEVDTRQVEGPLDNNLGLLVRYQDGDNFYWFEISSDGYYSVDLKQAEGWTSLLDWQPADAIRQGLDVTNHLKVVCQGDQFLFYVNDTHLVSLTDTSLTSGSIGLAVGAFDQAGVVVHFDNLKVYALAE
jgi:hypothetical protein